MVRRLTGTLVKVGLGEVSVAEFKGLLEGKIKPATTPLGKTAARPKSGTKRAAAAESNVPFDIAAWTAPASGLFLESVKY